MENYKTKLLVSCSVTTEHLEKDERVYAAPDGSIVSLVIFYAGYITLCV